MNTRSEPATPSSFVTITRRDGPADLEYRWVGLPHGESAHPVVVFLHEGLGSVSMWHDFPQRFCAAHGLTGLVYSRFGYGQSSVRPRDAALAPRYLHEQAHEDLPALLRTLEIRRPWLFGHSDGGSIALLYASRFPEHVSGIVVLAPHIFVEENTVAGLRAARAAFENGTLTQRLARHHRDVDSVFHGWNDAWLSPAFHGWNIEAEVARIRCPVLAVQGENDEYATLEQIEGIRRLCPQTRLLVLPGCGHIPHRERAEEVIDAAGAFITGG
ncbi:MAG TPA: alpha/beta hydrolase [Noviherbaspirillum sp.]|nr:alpha/beta hydrolase [Noviherbaspirillum sp.]